jgi:hypothetical protein
MRSLAFVGGYFNLYNNDSITNVGGLAALTTVEGYVNIDNNNGLINLDGLANLANIGTATNEYLSITNNPVLNSITGLIAPTGDLANLAGNLTVQSNAALSVCQPNQLRTQLQALGWARTYSGTGNLNCALMCVGAVCQ